MNHSPSSMPNEHTPDTRHVSTLLQVFLKEHTSKNITLGELTDTLSDRAFGMLMILFAVPNLVPIIIPGVSAILGVPLIVLAWQLAMGRKTPWFPRWLAERSLPRKDLQKVIGYSLPYLRRAEYILRPRWTCFFGPVTERFLALICLGLAIILTLPIPLGNWFPAFSICLFSLAILERDGVFVLLGAIATVLSLILFSTVIFAFIKGLWLLMAKVTA